MMRELTLLWQSLQDAEYLHLLLEPVPLFGLAFGLVFFLAGLAMRVMKMRMLALIVVAASCVSVQPAVSLRLKSEPRILALQDPAFHPLVKQQTERRRSTAWIYYALAVICIGALVVGKGGKGTIVTGVVVVFLSVGLMHALWLHKKECEVYHRNIVKYAPAH